MACLSTEDNKGMGFVTHSITGMGSQPRTAYQIKKLEREMKEKNAGLFWHVTASAIPDLAHRAETMNAGLF